MMKRTKPIAAALAALTAAASVASGQDLRPKAPPHTGTTVITGATVHTVSGETIENGVIVIAEDRFGPVGGANILSMISFPEDARFIDATGMDAYPGLIATSTRLGLTEVSNVQVTNDFNEFGDITPEVRVVVAINPDSTLFPVARAGGVLLAGVFPARGTMPGRPALVQLDGWTWEDMAVDPDLGTVIDWPRARPRRDPLTGKPNAEDASALKNTRAEIDALFDDAEAYDLAISENRLSQRDLRLDALLPIVRGEDPLWIAADEHDQIVEAIDWTSERGYRMVLVGGRDAELSAPRLISRDIHVVVTGVHRFPKRADLPHDHAFTLPARLLAAGVQVSLSPSDVDGNVRNLSHEAALAARYGLTRAQAIRAVTLSPAETLGIAEHYGSIESGKSATLILTDGDLLEITSRVAHAFIDGREIDLTSKQTELRDKYREKYRQIGIIENDSADGE